MGKHFWTYEEIKSYIESNGNKLLSTFEEVDNIRKIQKDGITHVPLKISCKDCENTYETDFKKYKKNNKFTCNECSHKRAGNIIGFSYEEIKFYIENHGIKLLTLKEEFLESKNNFKLHNTKVPLKILCDCGNEFITTFHMIKYENKIQCNNCGREQARINTYLEYEEVVNQLELHNRDFTLKTTKEQYIDLIKTNKNKDLKLKFECLNCGKEYSRSLVSAISSKHNMCRQCGLEHSAEKNMLNYEDIVLSTKNIGIILLETEEEFNYKKDNKIYKHSVNRVNVRCLCPLCNHEYTSSYATLIHNKKNICNKCSTEQVHLEQRKSHDVFLSEVYNLVKNDYSILEEYQKGNKKIKIRHNFDKCNHNEFYMSPNNFLRGNRCPICSRVEVGLKIRLTDSEFRQRVNEKLGDEYKILSKYEIASKKVVVEHTKCGRIYKARPSDLMQGCGCSKCSGKEKKTTESFKDEIRELIGEEYKVIGEYKNSNTKIKFIHTICQNEFNMSPSAFLIGHRCPICKESKGEQQIRKLLTQNDIVFEPQYNKISELMGVGGKPLRFDFAILSMNNKNDLKCLIEYDGEFHYKPIKNYKTEPIKYAEERLKKQQYHDQLKNEYCKEHNIKLIRIPYWDFDKIEQILIDNNIIHSVSKAK